MCFYYTNALCELVGLHTYNNTSLVNLPKIKVTTVRVQRRLVIDSN